MKFSSSLFLKLKCGANNVYSFSFENFFYNDTGGTLRRLLMQEVCDGLQSKEAPIDALDPAPRLDTYTVGFKGRGCCWAQLLGPLLAVFPCNGATLCRHSTSNRWSLRKPRLDSHMQGEIYMKLEIK